ncbi:YeeE/YedE family protein [Parasphingopyxis marina]|uniref:YeeE/YedE family protein n=1 Tax=Parasphingopyxis marina TaxID=2761622 RepID=A0A842HT84_9SPHN|nr:YeeE/YedE family protein [Parasphingopyxis marina]MBC2777098.1 YeeE/YedE family protein [Parasphingopyxis marina]
MRHPTIALVSGTLFGAGLALSGMTDPARVRGFLDLFGAWDPTLAFVMGGAVAVMALAWLVQKRLEVPVAGGGFALPDTQKLTGKLVAGSALFGIGWGIAGLCPGPAFASLALQPAQAAIFVLAMLTGMIAHHFVTAARVQTATNDPGKSA